MTHETMTQTQQVSEKAADLLTEFKRAVVDHAMSGNVSGRSATYMAQSEAHAALREYICSLEADAKRMTVLRSASTAFLFSNSGGSVTAVLGPASTKRIPHVTTHGDTLDKAIDNAYDSIVPLSARASTEEVSR